MQLTAIIGGSGLSQMPELENVSRQVMRTPFGEPSAPLIHGTLQNIPVVFLPRHGQGHTIAPHRVNYRANIQALWQAEVTRIIAVNTVGTISVEHQQYRICVPDQIIDYTSSRAHTFFDGLGNPLRHVGFTEPYSHRLTKLIVEVAGHLDIPCLHGGVYGCTQGPRFETAAEIDRMERDGANLVGMTGMPEAALAAERDIEYVSICVNANPAAGRGVIDFDEIQTTVDNGMIQVRKIIPEMVQHLG